VAGMRSTHLSGLAMSDELLLGKLADRFQHPVSGPPRRPVGDQQRLTHQSIQQIQKGEVIDTPTGPDVARVRGLST
jgi:hypothetical protein